MTREEYNKKVQEIQAIWPESGQRIRKVYHQAEVLCEAHFEVFLDRWRTLGIQRQPFKPDATFEWDENEEARVMYHFAGGVSSDRLPESNGVRTND